MLAFAVTLVIAVGFLGAAPIPAGAQLFYDSFEPPAQMAQWVHTGVGEGLQNDSAAVHTGVNAGRAWKNWRWPYTQYHDLPMDFTENVYLSVWVYEAVEGPPGKPGPWFDPLWSVEHVPQAMIRLEDRDGSEYLGLGILGKNKDTNQPQWPDNIYFCTYTMYGGKIVLSGEPNSTIPVPRQPGWRKWVVRIKPYTGAGGDALFYVDGQLVFSGQRMPGAYGFGAPVNRIELGYPVWTGENYWYDDVEFDYWPEPTTSASIADALSQPAGTWVRLPNLPVAECLPDSIRVEDSTGSVLVQPSRFAAPGDVVSVLGRVTDGANGRYLDALEVAIVTPTPIQDVTSVSEARALPDGTWMRLPHGVMCTYWANVRFMQQPDRACGVQIRSALKTKLGDEASLFGRVMTVAGAKLVDAFSTTTLSANNPLPRPLGANGRMLRLTNRAPEGLVVTSWGRVIRNEGGWYPAWIEIDDGSTQPGEPYVRVYISSSTAPANGTFVKATGSLGYIPGPNGVPQPAIYTRTSADVRQ